MSRTAKFILSLLFVLFFCSTRIYAAPIKVDGPQNVGVPESKLGEFINNAIILAVGISALVAFAFLIWGGIQWITSGGDKTQYEAARNRITYALVGLAIVAAAWAVMQLASGFFGVSVKEIDVPEIRDVK